MQSLIRIAATILGMTLAGFFAAYFSQWLIADRGTLGPTIMQSNSPGVAISGILLLSAAACGIGATVAKYTTSLCGMTIFGFSFFVLSMNLVGFEEFVLLKGNIWILIIEIVFLAMIVLLSSLVIFSLGGPMKDVPVTERPIDNFFLKTILISLLMLPAVWIVAKQPSNGQVLGATATGGILIGLAVRKYLSSVQPILFFSIPIGIGAVGYFVGIQLSPIADITLMQMKHSSLLYPMPLDYVGGAILGVSIGLNWGASLAIADFTNSASSKIS